MMETGTADTILYSGSFNPIHRGHLAVAEQVLQAFPGSELWLVVSPQNPLKSETDLAPEQHRLEMARIAVRHSLLHERMQVCDIEFSLPKPSATIHTLQALSARYPQRSFSLLIGSDNAACFNQWIAYQEILEHYPVLVYPREGHPVQPGPTTDRCTFLQDVPLLPQAATDIRGLIADNGKDTKALVERELPAGVWEYIKMHKLYGCR